MPPVDHPLSAQNECDVVAACFVTARITGKITLGWPTRRNTHLLSP